MNYTFCLRQVSVNGKGFGFVKKAWVWRKSDDMEGQRESVRRSVASCLTRVLTSDQLARSQAEEELKALEVTEEFGVVLATMTASAESPVQYRQLASILLKQYIEVHWSMLSDKFQEPELQDKSKVLIKEVLPSCLGDEQSKVRSAAAYTISTIAKWDWPDHWPNLFDLLVGFLESGKPNLVHGTMRVLSEFCRCVSDTTQLTNIANAILPHLLKVIVQADVYSAHTRARAVHIYNIHLEAYFSHSLSYPESVQLVLPSLQNYLPAFVEILGSEHAQNMDHGLRKQVIMTLCNLLRSFSQPLTPHIMSVVTPIWTILTQETTIYLSSVVNSDLVLDAACDSDGEVIGQECTIFAVFEFINVLGESDEFQSLLLPILPQLMYYMIVFMQITQEQLNCWMDDVNQFVDEDETSLSYSIRLSALDLVQSLFEESESVAPYASALTEAIYKHLSEAAPESSPHWWKVHEACMLACSVLVDGIKAQQVDFDAVDFTEQVLIPDITIDGSVLLSGRCLWLAGKLSSLLPAHLLPKLMEVVSKALHPSAKPVLRVLAAKAVCCFCNELESSDHVQLLRTWLPSYMGSLCELARGCSEEVVFIVVDSLQLVARMDVVVTAQYHSDIVPLAISLFLTYSHDPGISSCLEDLFEALSYNPGCHGSLHASVVSMALEILSPVSSLPLGLVAGVLDILVHVVRGCGHSSASLPQPFIHQVFPSVVKRILGCSDSTILQNGGQCVRAFVATAVEELASWQDQDGHTGLQYVIEVILHLLDPLVPEFSACYVGKLILVVVKKVGVALGQDLQLILRAVLSKMQNVSTASVMQSLVLVFARLLHTELEEIVSFLSHVPDPEGRPALDYVVSEWCSRHPYFYGAYESRVSALGLCHLLSHCVATGDKRLTQMLITARNYSSQFQSHLSNSSLMATPLTDKVQLPVKILKLLVHDVEQFLKAPQQGDEEVLDSVEMTLEKLISSAATYSDKQWDATEQDVDILDDPVMQLDVQAHLRKYLVELAQQACFTALRDYLTTSELNTILSLRTETSNA